jgi:heptaprenyl diphosphate synthase
MPSYDERTSTTEESSVKAVWILLAVALNTLELFIPRLPLFPWLKPGLANSITMLWIITWGTRDALLYTVVRVWIASFYFGFSLITMSLALSGGLLATAGMGLAWRLFGTKKLLGGVGMGVIGAALHNAGQLVMVYLLLTRTTVIFYQLPLMGAASLLSGAAVGAIAPILLQVLEPAAVLAPKAILGHSCSGSTVFSWRKKVTVIGILAGAVALVGVNSAIVLGVVAAGTSVCACMLHRGDLRRLFYPVRFWFLFLFIGVVYLFFSHGTRIGTLPFVTIEGVCDGGMQLLRLWSWLQAGVLLQTLKGNRILFAALQRIFPARAATLLAGLVALEYFPAVLLYVKSSAARHALPWKRPATAVALFAKRAEVFILKVMQEEMQQKTARR